MQAMLDGSEHAHNSCWHSAAGLDQERVITNKAPNGQRMDALPRRSSDRHGIIVNNSPNGGFPYNDVWQWLVKLGPLTMKHQAVNDGWWATHSTEKCWRSKFYICQVLIKPNASAEGWLTLISEQGKQKAKTKKNYFQQIYAVCKRLTQS